MIVYRITHAAYANKLVASGNPARWNSRDVKLIYTSQSRALSCLENIVHRNSRGLNQNFRVIEIDVPDLYISVLSMKELPQDWHRFENMLHTQSIGDQWISKGSSAVLQVPSVIIPGEYNYLLNPMHAGFKKISIRNTYDFAFDERLR